MYLFVQRLSISHRACARPAALAALLLGLLALLAAGGCERSHGPGPRHSSAQITQRFRGDDSSYQALDRVLHRYVKDGLVDYRALKVNPGDLVMFLEQAAAVSERQYGSWSDAQKKAFLINLYNAATLRLIIDHYPVSSIRRIGSMLKGPWDLPVVRLFGKRRTLGFVEHQMLRKLGDPRIHFAIVCASIGCPRLQSFAYLPGRLEAQLDRAAREFAADRSKNRFDANGDAVTLSPIFDWYREDFAGKDGSVLNYVARYAPADARTLLLQRDPTVRYSDYDWSLNERAGAAAVTSAGRAQSDAAGGGS